MCRAPTSRGPLKEATMGVEDIKKLRKMTSLGVNECKKALDASKGDFKEALEVLKKRGIQMMEGRKDRKASQGLVESYIHFSGNLGVLVEVNCETDFVARTEGFKKFVKDLAMHIAAAGPQYLSKEDVPAELLKTVDNIDDYVKTTCLFEQKFVKNDSITIKDYLQELTTQTGENVIIRRFARFAVGAGE